LGPPISSGVGEEGVVALGAWVLGFSAAAAGDSASGGGFLASVVMATKYRKEDCPAPSGLAYQVIDFGMTLTAFGAHAE
jgi:hypothetical protein